MPVSVNSARQIASRYPIPDFYKDFPVAHHISGEFFETDPVICQLRGFVSEHLEDDFGHGLQHAVKVTLDTGALILIESRNLLLNQSKENQDYQIACIPFMRRVLTAQCAGLLHDIKRKEENHAVAGAAYAGEILKNYPLMPHEREDICQAIRNHEAFKDTVKINTTEGELISDCLYDADKFRWVLIILQIQSGRWFHIPKPRFYNLWSFIRKECRCLKI